MKIMQTILFLTIVTSVYTGMHYFVYSQLITPFRLTGWSHRTVVIFFWIGALSFILGEVCSNRHYEQFYWLLFAGSVWLGIISIALTCTLLRWIIIKFLPIPWKMPSLYITMGLITCLVIVSLINGLSAPVIKKHTLSIPDTMAPFRGFRFVHLSDIHIGNLTTVARIQHIIHEVNKLSPDLILITGDLFDGFNGDEEKDAMLLKGLSAPHGIVVIPGNHEYYSGIDTFVRISESSGAIVLRDRVHVLDNGISLVGFDDYDRRYAHKKQIPVADVMRTIDTKKPIIALRHRPLLVDEAIAHGTLVQLSGHTHAGQLPPMDIMVFFAYKYPMGLYKIGDSYMYTSPGTGTWGPPMRLFSRNEITVFELR